VCPKWWSKVVENVKNQHKEMREIEGAQLLLALGRWPRMLMTNEPQRSQIRIAGQAEFKSILKLMINRKMGFMTPGSLSLESKISLGTRGKWVITFIIRLNAKNALKVLETVNRCQFVIGVLDLAFWKNLLILLII
jgi:hypothetical protein